MLEITILLAPSIFCLIWSLINIMSSARTYRYWIFSLYMITVTVYFYSETYLFAGLNSSNALMVSDFVYKFAATILPSVTMLYSRRVAFHKYYSKWIATLLILAIVLVTLIAYTTAIIGTNNCIQFYNDKSNGIDNPLYHTEIYMIHHILTYYIYKIFTHILYFATFAYILYCLYKRNVKWKDIVSFFKKEKLERHNLQLILTFIFTALIFTRFLLKKSFIHDYEVASCIISLALCIIVLIVGYVEVFVKMPMIQISSILHPIEVITIPEQLNLEENKIEVDLSINKKFLDNQSKLNELFSNLMDRDHFYTNKGITLDDVAKAMQTNKTYVSLLVNNVYKKSFPDYINSKRIEFAKKLIQASKEKIKLEDIAELSGFQSVIQLTRKFKAIEGITLREWLTTANQNGTEARR